MKKKSAIILCILTVVLVVLGVGVNLLRSAPEPQPAAPVMETNTLINHITAELLSGGSALELGIAKAVAMSVTEQTADKIIIEVSAPDISTGLIEWMESVTEETFSEAALEETSLRLLSESPPVVQEFELELRDEDGVATPVYTGEFAGALSCGLLTFYEEANQRMVNELIEG